MSIHNTAVADENQHFLMNAITILPRGQIHLHYRGRIQRKTWRMGPYAVVEYNLSLHMSTPTHLPWATL